MRVNAPAPDHVPAGWRQLDSPAPSEHWPGEEHRSSYPRAQLGVEAWRADLLGMNRQVVLAGPGCLGSNRPDQVDKRLRVTDAGYVRQTYRLVREQGRRNDGKGSILVSAGLDGPRELVSSFNNVPDVLVCA